MDGAKVYCGHIEGAAEYVHV